MNLIDSLQKSVDREAVATRKKRADTWAQLRPIIVADDGKRADEAAKLAADLSLSPTDLIGLAANYAGVLALREKVKATAPAKERYAAALESRQSIEATRDGAGRLAAEEVRDAISQCARGIITTAERDRIQSEAAAHKVATSELSAEVIQEKIQAKAAANEHVAYINELANAERIHGYLFDGSSPPPFI